MDFSKYFVTTIDGDEVDQNMFYNNRIEDYHCICTFMRKYYELEEKMKSDIKATINMKSVSINGWITERFSIRIGHKDILDIYNIPEEIYGCINMMDAILFMEIKKSKNEK